MIFFGFLSCPLLSSTRVPAAATQTPNTSRYMDCSARRRTRWPKESFRIQKGLRLSIATTNQKYRYFSGHVLSVCTQLQTNNPEEGLSKVWHRSRRVIIFADFPPSHFQFRVPPGHIIIKLSARVSTCYCYT